AGAAPAQPAAAAPPAPPPDRQWPLVHDALQRPLSIDEGRALAPAPGGAAVVLAALDRAAPSATLDDGPGLPWAATPQLPRMLSRARDGRAVPSHNQPALAVLPAPPPAADPLSEASAQRVLLPFASEPARASTLHEPRVSRRVEPLWLASLPHSQRPAHDPLAASAEPPRPAAGPAFILPFENGRVSSLFNQGRRHPAIDLAGRHGSPVLATSHGQTVTFAGWRGGYGNAVITRDAQGREHLYGHLSAIHVRPGRVLAQGERLGLLGSTGYSTGPHVHYEVKDRRGVHINPVTLLFPRGVRNGYAWAGTGLASAKTVVAAASRR
ncbi:MAG: M23 family metallopeptidase, partial [Hyphomicrobiaceae bacterium]|nr:M23 family metallopeptidase [Hyphomicrobiaceae bacterium]